MITAEEILQKEVRALNWKQPYAELMKHGKQETRTWATAYRSLVLICASANPYGDIQVGEIAGPEQYARIIQTLGVKWFNAVKRQNAIAIGRLVGCFSAKSWNSEQHKKTFEEKTFVAWKENLFVHTYEDVTPITPFFWRGSQGWRKLTDEQKQLIHLL